MKAYTSNNIRNIAVVGHGGKGKTTLCEAMLYVSGATDRLGRVADGNTVLDFDPEEKRRKSSVSSAMAATSSPVVCITRTAFSSAPAYFRRSRMSSARVPEVRSTRPPSPTSYSW